MRNIKLTIAYDGGDFHGWQIQPGQSTIQGILSKLLAQITQEELTLHGAGRTDAGVHAWGQVANFKTRSEMAPLEFARALNALLPPSIRVRQAEEASQDFHARWLALAKTYHYRIYRGPVVPPSQWRYVLHYPFPLDFAAMAHAARFFEGEHDFTSFAASSGSEKDDQERTTLRSLYRSEMRQCSNRLDGEMLPGMDAEPALHGHEWVYLVRGKSFLRHMVRKIVGTLLEVGRGRLAPEDVPRLLELSDRACSGPTVPPQGLCLQSVEYSESA